MDRTAPSTIFGAILGVVTVPYLTVLVERQVSTQLAVTLIYLVFVAVAMAYAPSGTRLEDLLLQILIIVIGHNVQGAYREVILAEIPIEQRPTLGTLAALPWTFTAWAASNWLIGLVNFLHGRSAAQTNRVTR